MDETVDTAPQSGAPLDAMPTDAVPMDALPTDAVAAPEGGAGFLAGDGGFVARLFDFIDAGGPVVVILFACSVVAFAIILVKLWQFHAARLGDRRRAAEAVALLRGGRAEEALALLSGARNPVAQVVVRAIRGRRRRDLPEAAVREEVLRTGNELLERLRGQLGALEVIGAVAPLLGLFGTVLGMIEAFRRLSEAGSQVDPAILSGGIWEALLTTAVGLAVAIPVVVLCNWFERRVERVAHEMENLVTQVFTPDLSIAPEQGHDSVNLRLAGAD